MKLTALGLQNPTAVSVVVIIMLLFGSISYSLLPIQLIPELEEPKLSIRTHWRAATPEEVEAEIVERQEKALRGLPGMHELLARAQSGRADVDLSFVTGTDMNRALVEVLNRLNQVSDYPEDVDEPYISSTGSDARPIAWFIVHTVEGNSIDIESYREYIEDRVQSKFERVPGIARSEVFGGRESEIRVSFDPYKLADLDIPISSVSELVGASKDVSAGFVEQGRREYSMRFTGKYGLDEIDALIIAWRDGRPVYLRDVATVQKRLADASNFVISGGKSAIAVNAQREIGVNVLEVMHILRQAAAELQEGPLRQAGLEIRQVYDETGYIDQSMRLLYGSLSLGVMLAMIVLWLFLRRVRATMAVLLSVPVCLLSTFIVLHLGGRTLNVISLAGLAFAVGMVLDASIVVLENIVRLREQSQRGRQDLGSIAVSQVWGALFASTITTVVVFLPIIFLESEAGQLFADLALSLAAAICISLLVAIFVVPTAEACWVGPQRIHQSDPRRWEQLTRLIMLLTDSPLRRLLWIVSLISISLLCSYLLKPKLDYLPEGSRNLVFAFVQPAPGSGIEYIKQEMGDQMKREMAPYLAEDVEPRVRHYFFVGFSQRVFMGAIAEDPTRIKELLPLMRNILSTFPDTLAFVKQVSLFGDLGAGKSIDIDVQGRELEPLFAAALYGFLRIPELIPGAQVRPLPGLVLAKPELQLQPDEERLAEAGWTRRTLAQITRSLGDGLDVGDYFDGERNLNIILRAEHWQTPEELMDTPLVTPEAGTVLLKGLTRMVRTVGSEEIRRIDQRRTVSLQILLPPEVSLEEALQRMRTDLEPELLSRLPADAEIYYRGTAEKLESAVRDMAGSFILAVIVLYLLMSALFRSFFYSLLVIMTLPLATVGGILSLRVLNQISFQPLDLLTMIGFIILLGLVVNNAILLVYQARTAERDGLARREAVRLAVRTRLRPVLMSTFTSIFGMLPLVLAPGAGTEIYRGLATVVTGGMFLSVVFTLILLPSLLRIGEDRSRILKTSTV